MPDIRYVSPLDPTASTTETFPPRVEYSSALAQQIFSILQLRTKIRFFQLKFVTCRKWKAETFAPIMIDFPRERLAFRSLPFSNTGIDCFGLFFFTVKRLTE